MSDTKELRLAISFLNITKQSESMSSAIIPVLEAATKYADMMEIGGEGVLSREEMFSALWDSREAAVTALVCHQNENADGVADCPRSVQPTHPGLRIHVLDVPGRSAERNRSIPSRPMGKASRLWICAPRRHYENAVDGQH